jgi:AcrR family transcriptional regulator
LQAIKTKKRLFRSAVTLMDDFGYDNVTIEDISQKAGVSVGAFYHYYKSKTDILLELYVHIDDYFEMIVEPLVNGDDVFENIRVFLTHYADYNAEKGHSHVKLLFETHDRLFVDKSRYMYALFRRVIEQGKASGQLTQEYTVDEIEDSYFVFARGVIYDWILHESDYDLHSRMLKHIDLLEKSYRA